jgi:hypothetical protein
MRSCKADSPYWEFSDFEQTELLRDKRHAKKITPHRKPTRSDLFDRNKNFYSEV